MSPARWWIGTAPTCPLSLSPPIAPHLLSCSFPISRACPRHGLALARARRRLAVVWSAPVKIEAHQELWLSSFSVVVPGIERGGAPEIHTVAVLLRHREPQAAHTHVADRPFPISPFASSHQGEPRIRYGLFPLPSPSSVAGAPPSPPVTVSLPPRAPYSPALLSAWAGQKTGCLGHQPGLEPSLGRPQGRLPRVTARPMARPGQFEGRPVWPFSFPFGF